jgi:hypothetical protein
VTAFDKFAQRLHAIMKIAGITTVDIPEDDDDIDSDPDVRYYLLPSGEITSFDSSFLRCIFEIVNPFQRYEKINNNLHLIPNKSS